MKKALALVLSLLVAFSMFAVVAAAEEAAEAPDPATMVTIQFNYLSETGETTLSTIYVAPGEKPGFRRMVGADAWRTGDNIYSYFEVRTGGGGYGTGGEAHYGHVAQWYFLANTAQWKLIPVSKTTSINDIIIDEPCGEVVSETYYTTAGVAIPVPAKGVNIVRKVYANGVVEAKKIFVK